MEALGIAVDRFNFRDPSSKAIVLLSDGGDTTDMLDTDRIKSLFRGKNAILETLGLGREKPSPIPAGRNLFGDIMYKQYEGRIVLSGLNSENLKTLSKI